MRAPIVALLLLAALLAGCTAKSRDSDGDGLRDATEKDWPGLIVDFMDRRVRIEVSSDKTRADTDGDGLGDFDEFFSKTNPREPDTDRDGLTDCQELIHTVQSECEDPAFAGDYDGGFDTSPTRADSDPGPVRYMNEAGRFTDETKTLTNGRVEWGDGLSDKTELDGYRVDLGGGRTRQVTSSPRDPDSDGDGLEDGEEALVFASDPSVQDTDGDQCNDGNDPWPGRLESYAIGLQRFKLKVDKDASGSDLAFTFQVAATVSTSEVGHVDKGVEVDISSHSPPPTAGRGCPAGPLLPWVEIQIAATDPDVGSGAQHIDFNSISGATAKPPNVQRLYWNVRTDEFSWTAAGPLLPEPLQLKGVDADLSLTPQVLFSQGS